MPEQIIQVKLIMFNTELALYSIVTVRFDRTSTGSVDVSSSIHILKPVTSKTSGDDKRMILEITFCVLLFILVVREMMSCTDAADLHSFRWGLPNIS